MTTRIAILGWGSLLWDLDDLAPRVTGPWAMRAGPRLPMEFSRISIKRKMGLVLCLDPAVGSNCATHAIPSIRQTIAAARTDLAARERAPVDRIGWASADGTGESRLGPVPPLIAAWCRENGWAGAVWTDLEPNFLETTGTPFSIDAGRAYLRTLEGESLEEAHRYIRNAPWTTRTPLRRALSRDPWWRGLRAGSR
ncbi:hypothetical protein [Amaricoccus macauensis]|uniref:hypothetical protein n=1 Tax=Amaricoccus macauensis TaxID=57001 RepID=UPI003C7B2AE2